MNARPRPIGWSPGTGSLAAAWAVGALIARLTGASAVVIVLGGTIVAVVAELVAGFLVARRVAGVAVVSPGCVTVDEPVPLTIRVTSRDRRRPLPARRWLVTVSSRDERLAGIAPTSDSDVEATAIVRFPSAGVVDSLSVDVDVVGPLGLVWWRRRGAIPIDEVHVAPAARGPMLPVEHGDEVDLLGSVAARTGRHAGDIDGLRAWRPGQEISAIHWPTSLRADELIVHDRTTAHDDAWILDLGAEQLDPGRVRHTLEHGVAGGHAVAVRTTAGEVEPVRTLDDAARRAAEEAERARPPVARRSILRRAIRLTRPEPAQLDATSRWSAGVAAIVAMTMLAGALGVSTVVTAFVVVATLAGVVVTLRASSADGRRPLVVRVLVILAVLVALTLIAVDAGDVDSLLAALRGPLPDLLVMLVVLHGFEVVDRRTLRVHQAIGLVVVTYAAGLRIDDRLGWFLLAWGVAFAVSLRTTTGRPTRRDHRTGTTAHERRARSARTASGVIGWAAGFTVATIAVLAAVPIPDGPARLGLPAISNGAPRASQPGALVGADGAPVTPGGSTPSRGDVVGYPGFTDALDTSVRGELGDELVMRVRSPQPAFWRGQTFAEFDGRNWYASDDIGLAHDGPVVDVPPTLGDAVSGAVPSEPLVQTYFVEQDLPNVVFAAARPTQVVIDATLWTRPDGALRSDVTLTAGSVYTVVSERVQVTAGVLAGQGDIAELFAGYRTMTGGQEVEPFLEVPPSTTERTVELAESLHVPGASTYDTILAYQDWIAANTAYDLDAPVPAPGVDAVDDFLFGSRRGFCEQIASALVVMLRTQGVPARLATGYVSGQRDRVSGVWNVRASDAHAWVEVWFPLTGWQAFDPTADVPLAGDASTGTVGGDLVAAAFASARSHATTIALAAFVAGAGWVLVGAVRRRIDRHRRGRWGALQDRFTVLGQRHVSSRDASRMPTNREIARTLRDGTTRRDARPGPGAADRPADAPADEVAAALDRAAFDPDWADDDDAYRRARDGVATLERRAR